VSLLYRTNVAEFDSASYRQALFDERPSDRQRTFTRLGPHRDDLRFVLDGRDLRDLGSQGEQRTVLLALLLAERQWLRRRAGISPLLLLDDVMSELDFARRRQLLTSLADGGQALITTTTLDYFTSEELSRMKIVELPARYEAASLPGWASC
jgi:DNA replication and repair protein RecF